MAKITAGFISYVHEVDAHGDVSRFRVALEQAICEHGREDFKIFQDRNNIQWGDDWKERVITSFDDALFLIPIISPRLFRSDACRFEISAFFERQTRFSGIPLVLPVYFVTTPEYEASAQPSDDLVLKLRQAHTHLDWRQLRMLPETDPAYRRAIMEAAERIARLLDRIEARAAANLAPTPPSPPVPVPPQGPRYRRFWVPATLATLCVVAVILSLGEPELPPADRSQRHPPIPEAKRPFEDPKPALEALNRRCIVQEHLESRNRPKADADWGPHLSPGQEVQLTGKVIGSDWLAFKTEDDTVFYLKQQACSG